MDSCLADLAKRNWALPEPADDGVYYFAGDGRASISYPDQGFGVLGIDGGSGPWFDHRAQVISKYIYNLQLTSMWEVGGGTGAMASRLTPILPELIVVEPIPTGARAQAKLGRVTLCGTLQDLVLPSNCLDSIGLFDVLEHLAEPRELLSEVRRVLKPRGYVLATVPAFNWLWGDEDEVSGHYRRYNKANLTREFMDSGFDPIVTEYIFASLVPPAALLRALPYKLGRRVAEQDVLSRMKSQLDVNPKVRTLMSMAFSIETAVARRIPLPFGLSIAAVFRAT